MVDVQKLKKRFRTQAERNALARIFGTAAAACKPIGSTKPARKTAKKRPAKKASSDTDTKARVYDNWRGGEV